ncbi:hypothetical protein MMC25_001745 [Agyrium rufum]|nr:hypothetical protein [Agyrium rufum]
MDAYPSHYISHNVPLIVLSGLAPITSSPGQDDLEKSYPLLEEKGVWIAAQTLEVVGEEAEELLRCFNDFDARDASWNHRPGKGKMGTMSFTYRKVGRSFVLPPRKARPPQLLPGFDSNEGEDEAGWKASFPVLHSPLSPLTPDSPTFPDGILTPLWFGKHQSLLPAAIISFFNFTLDFVRSNTEDDELKSEINAIRTALTNASFKSRLVVVLVSQDDGSDADTVQERLANIRRATNLDAKSLYLLPKDQSAVNIRAFVASLLSSIHPACIEYYRDLSKHARRKRNRSTTPAPTAPPTSGTSRVLSSQGWNVRYETKMGFFAEYRQEMDTAGRCYDSAYDALFEGDLFESISDWSPRFNETRMLADIIAIRIVRCLLWSGQTTAAVKSWTNHRERMHDFIDRKGKGTNTYGWAAWEARWSSVMAEMLEKVDLPIFQFTGFYGTPENQVKAIPNIYANSEKPIPPEERYDPWQFLHHAGYWLWRAVKETRIRRKRALTIPEEDRTSPGQSPASLIVSRAHTYETYLCPSPHLEYSLDQGKGFDHAALIVSTLRKSADAFSKRQQIRTVERLAFDVAQECIDAGKFQEAMEQLKPMWRNLSWRKAGWWNLVEMICWAIRRCARHTADVDILLKVEWELLSNSLASRQDWRYDISRCLDELKGEKRPHVRLKHGDTAPTVSAAFCFAALESRVGEPLQAQLTMKSQAQESSLPLTISEVSIKFEGLRSLTITHIPDEGTASEPNKLAKLVDISSTDLYSKGDDTPKPSSLQAVSDLTFQPGKIKIFNLSLYPREPGEVSVSSATIVLDNESFKLEVDIPFGGLFASCDWWTSNQGISVKKQIRKENYTFIKILPKPPKIKIEFLHSLKVYYTNEEIALQIVTINDEDEDVNLRLEIKLIGSDTPIPLLRVADKESSSDAQAGSSAISLESQTLVPKASRTEHLTFTALIEPADYILEVTAHYNLASDPETPIIKSASKDIVCIRPFEANFDPTPRVHPDPWPSYFRLPDEPEEESDSEVGKSSSKAFGLIQTWILTTQIASFAIEPLIIRDVALEVLELTQGAVYSAVDVARPEANSGSEKNLLAPQGLLDRTFPFTLQKLSLEDRRSSTLNAQLRITWQREGSNNPTSPSFSPTTDSLLLITPLVISFSEPRVIVTANIHQPQSSSPPISSQHPPFTPSQFPPDLPLTHLSYTLENPSAYHLSFSLSMDSSEEFAFSGPKAIQVNLVPLSRSTVRYQIVPLHLDSSQRQRKTRGRQRHGRGPGQGVSSEDNDEKEEEVEEEAEEEVWVRPVLRVRDIGFNRDLRVNGGDGCKFLDGRLAIRVR